MYLYLIRHGQSVENTHEWDGRNENSPLTELGLQQADALAAWLAEHLRFDVLYASPMRRARQTADKVAAAVGLLPIFDDRLREVGNAYPDGSPFDEQRLPRYHLDVWGSIRPYEAITEGGENWMQFRARVGGFVEWLVMQAPPDHENLRIGVVCHGGVIEGVFEHVFQKGPWSAVIVHSNNTGITQLEYRPQLGKPSWWLHFHNRTCHLRGDQIT